MFQRLQTSLHMFQVKASENMLETTNPQPSRVTMFAKKKGLETGVYKCQQDLSILEKSWDIIGPSTL